MTRITLSILVDNEARPGFAAEHGFACWVELEGLRLLFDTGQGPALFENARRLGIDLATADMLVLSHGHYDHSGNVAAVLALRPDLPVYCHPDVLLDRYSLRQDRACSIGMPEPCRAAIRSALWRHWVTAPLGLHPALGLLGPVPRHTAFEDTGGSFWLDARGRMPDLIHDDLSLWIDTPEGLLLLTGCCHAGIINTVQRARDVTGREHIALVLGGLHLQQASDSRMEQTLHGLEACGCRTVMPCHCTGEEAIRILQHRFPHGLRQAGAGAVLEFGH